MIKWEDLTEVEQLCQDYSDFSKEVYGFRTRLPQDITVEAARAAMDELAKFSVGVFAREEEEQKERIARFEALVSVTIRNGAGDRAAAIRWLMDANLSEWFKHDVEHFEYEMGIPFGYIKKTAEAV